jgi:hypothetical protein
MKAVPSRGARTRRRPPARILQAGTAGALLLLSLVLPAAPAAAATISGRIFTADDPDSIAPGAPVLLVFRPPDGEMQRLQTKADEGGHFHFMDLAPDTAIAYVLRIDYRGMQFLSAPIKFAPDEDLVDFNVLLSGGREPTGEMPAGHPSLGGTPPLGSPIRPNTLHTVLLVLWVVLIFAAIAVIARRRTPAEEQALPAPARDLVRDIASLDNRHADGVIGEEEYQKVRESLMRRLRAMSAKGRRA